MRLSRIAFLLALVGFSATIAKASRVVITAPDPTCGEGAVNPFFGNTITIDGTMTQNYTFTYCGSAPLSELIVDVTPTLPKDSIFCLLLGTAFNECATSTDSTPPPPGLTILDLFCDTSFSPCTGLKNADGVGVGFFVPEPPAGELLLLGLSVPFFGLGVRKTWRGIRNRRTGRRLSFS
jgi:hypothetical protein